MSACDGSGRAIGCPGCQECRAEMAEIESNISRLLGLTSALGQEARRVPPGIVGDPWAQTITDEPEF